MNILEMIAGRSVIAPVLVVVDTAPVVLELSTESDCDNIPRNIKYDNSRSCAYVVGHSEELEAHELMMNGCDNLIDLIS